MAEQANAGRMTGSEMLPTSTSAVNRAPPIGTLYTAASPEPAPQETSSRRCCGDSRAHRAITLPDAPPISLGAASRPIEAPKPMTISEIADVLRLRQNDSSPVPRQSESSTSVGPLAKRL